MSSPIDYQLTQIDSSEKNQISFMDVLTSRSSQSESREPAKTIEKFNHSNWWLHLCLFLLKSNWFRKLHLFKNANSDWKKPKCDNFQNRVLTLFHNFKNTNSDRKEPNSDWKKPNSNWKRPKYNKVQHISVNCQQFYF